MTRKNKKKLGSRNSSFSDGQNGSKMDMINPVLCSRDVMRSRQVLRKKDVVKKGSGFLR